jgi:ABC-type multidrug transport system fused ATPase/permease subunit
MSKYSSSSSDELELATFEENGKKKPAIEDEDELGKAALYEDDEEMAIVSKYAKVNQPCPFSQHPPKHSINLEWRDINYKVVFPLPPSNLFFKLLLKLPIPDMLTKPFKKKMEMHILHDVSGSVRSGELIAIMGPTGSGKTTLLNVLARRIKRNVTGDILVNGESVQGRRLKRRMAYVLQDDIFFPNLTVRDTVSYTAYLKLSKSLSWKEKRERVDEILTELGIQRCSNTIVGGGWVVPLLPSLPSFILPSFIPGLDNCFLLLSSYSLSVYL